MRRIFFALPIVLALCGIVRGADKTIYVKPFAITEGLPAKTDIGDRVKNYVSEYIIERGGYSLVTDDEVKQVLEQEQLKMALDACYDDACIKKLLESIKTDFVMFGTVGFSNQNYIVSVKMLDRTSGTVRLHKVKTLEFKIEDQLKSASKDLAAYIIDGKEIDTDKYKTAKQIAEERPARIPGGIAVAYEMFTPVGGTFKEYYDSLQGGCIFYTKDIKNYFAVTGGIDYVTGDDKYKFASVSLNSYYAGARLGYPIFYYLYPYLSVMAKAVAFYEKGKFESQWLFGYGCDAAAGLALMVTQPVAIYGEYRYAFGKLTDSKGTDISGTMIAGGAMYKW